MEYIGVITHLLTIYIHFLTSGTSKQVYLKARHGQEFMSRFPWLSKRPRGHFVASGWCQFGGFRRYTAGAALAENPSSGTAVFFGRFYKDHGCHLLSRKKCQTMFLGPQKNPRRGNFRNEVFFSRFMTPNFTKPIFHQTSVAGCAASC